MSATLHEYLFVDPRRLDAYAAQILPSGEVVEKVKEWSAELSLTGPKAGAKQTERVRSLTIDEKVNLILKHLGTSSDLRSDPLRGSEAFVLEQFEAFKVIVPADADAGSKNPLIVLWFARDQHRHPEPSFLCLVEDFRSDEDWPGEDARPMSRFGCSDYTILLELVTYTHGKLQPRQNPSDLESWSA
jgi:hypothetical protein